MARLIPLSDIPYRAREAEARERAKWPTRAMALDAATYEIVEAPGTFGGAFPATIGWVLTREAAEAIGGELCHMPGGTCHHLWQWQENTYYTSAAMGDYIEAIARGVPRAQALAAYEAGRKSARSA